MFRSSFWRWQHLIIAFSSVVLMLIALPISNAGASSTSLRRATATSYPDTTNSYYETTTSYSVLYNQGCSDGSATHNGVTILDFGRPAYYNSNYGTLLFNTLNFASDSAILSAAEAYADGYWNCSPYWPQLSIALGTNNSCSTGSPCCSSGCSKEPPSFSYAGQLWQWYIHQLATYISNKGYTSQEGVSGADDAEPAYDPKYTNTYNFLYGYNCCASSTYYLYALWDYGSLESGYWTNSQEYYVAYGAIADWPFPEIYYTNMASQWENLDLWAHQQNMGFYVQGVMSEYPYDSSLTPHQGYDAMLSKLQSYSQTSQSNIPYLTDI